MRNTPIHIGKIQGAIFTPQTGSVPSKKATPEMTKSLPEPNLTKTTSMTVEGIPERKLLTRMIVTGDDDTIPINGRMIPKFLAKIFLLDRLATVVVFETTVF
jgi:hypothetical protein